MKNLFPVFLALLFIVPTACKKPEMAKTETGSDTAHVTGTVNYRERMALTQQAVVEVSLQDVSIADAPAALIAQQRITNPGQVPIHFDLSFPPADIDQRRSYSVQVRITDRDQLMFISDTHTPVLTRGAGKEVSMMLARVQDGSKENSKAGKAESHGIDLEGMFRYMADAATFRDCRDNRVYPVAMEAQYIELERAYLNSGVSAGNEILIRLRGRYLERPTMEENISKVSLIVDTLNEISADDVCTPSLHADRQNTYWKLIEVQGEPVVTPQGMREAHLILASAESRAHGFAGCNNFFGNYQADGDSLSFSPIGATMMACAEGMDTEQAFLRVLGEANRTEISGQIMNLYADDRLLARFEAVYL